MFLLTFSRQPKDDNPQSDIRSRDVANIEDRTGHKSQPGVDNLCEICQKIDMEGSFPMSHIGMDTAPKAPLPQNHTAYLSDLWNF
jgi:hypothetical protein